VVVYGVPGAFDTIWNTELWYRNGSGKPLSVGPLWTSDHYSLLGQTENLILAPRPASAPGEYVWVTRDGSEKVQFDLRLSNSADRSANWGVKIPVVREEEFRDSVDLINVPTSTDFRSALRVYALDDTFPERASVTVSVYSNLEQLLATTDLSLAGSPRYGAIMSIAETFPQIGTEKNVRVHIQAQDSVAKLWAFITAVSNQTQYVSVISPE
jgi:hypothetical protein